MCLSRESLASVKWQKKRPRKRFSWVVCWGLLTQAVCSHIINKLKSCCSSQECGIGGLNSSARKILTKRGGPSVPGMPTGSSGARGMD